ncbi:MAG TPA: ATP-grasp domain-containing protein [Azospira sp.]|nr:ATP-grasp domain-containing protein [Azospira sp.]
MRVLVLDGHSRAALETLQALGKVRAEVDVASETADALAFCSTYLHDRLVQPSTVAQEDFLAWLQDLDQSIPYALIVPSTEASLIALNGLPDDHPLRAKAIIPSRQSIDTALDKRKTFELATRLNIPVPPSHLLLAPGRAAPPHQFPAAFPLVMKPVRSKVVIGKQLVTINAALVADHQARNDYLKSWLAHTPILESEYFPGHGVGIELLFNRGKKCWHFAHERIHECPLSGGASSYRRAIEPPPAMLADAERLLQELHWHGVAMVEFKMNGQVGSEEDYRLIEINPRLWGSLALSIDAGVNFPLGLQALALGQAPGPQPAYRFGYYTRDLLEDIGWLRENLRADHADPLLLTRPRFRSFLELFRPLLGQESWDHFDPGDLAVTGALMGRLVAKYAGALGRRLARSREKSPPGSAPSHQAPPAPPNIYQTPSQPWF